MARPYKCPYCGAQDTVSKGRRRTKTMGDRSIRLCKACRRKFTPRGQKALDVPASAAQEIPNREPATSPVLAVQIARAPVPEQVPATPSEQPAPSPAADEPGT